ncbi:hypothetical protein TSOC_014905 [Tetrabaena socialis]|uniref:Uncharacterized protein n=1 Tax=Tetrabaena socialis TaxID=47790 RepID=A0A2J7ZGG8_9CHLO|nr:hypothetical protein TSOC_014905 [Tetrabaena socialis]|eukprot:PNG99319.1 hypothetical protein TSOC_014905 [Tetrabaena socialis]
MRGGGHDRWRPLRLEEGKEEMQALGYAALQRRRHTLEEIAGKVDANLIKAKARNVRDHQTRPSKRPRVGEPGALQEGSCTEAAARQEEALPTVQEDEVLETAREAPTLSGHNPAPADTLVENQALMVRPWRAVTVPSPRGDSGQAATGSERARVKVRQPSGAANACTPSATAAAAAAPAPAALEASPDNAPSSARHARENALDHLPGLPEFAKVYRQVYTADGRPFTIPAHQLYVPPEAIAAPADMMEL